MSLQFVLPVQIFILPQSPPLVQCATFSCSNKQQKFAKSGLKEGSIFKKKIPRGRALPNPCTKYNVTIYPKPIYPILTLVTRAARAILLKIVEPSDRHR